MNPKIRFNGFLQPFPAADSGPRTPSQAPHVSQIAQDFLHYLGKRWIYEHTPPNTADELARFDVREAIKDYRAYLSAGGLAPVDDAFTIEEAYLVTQIAAQKPLVCLLNDEYSEIEVARIGRIRLLPAAEMVRTLEQSYKVKLDTRGNIPDQVRQAGGLCPMYLTLVYDGKSGHCIVLTGIDQETGRLVIWDSWPVRSLLCEGQNEAGVVAEPVSDDFSYWSISAAEARRVFCAAFVPCDDLIQGRV